MNFTTDFLHFKTIFHYLLILSLVLAVGWIGKDIAAILITLVILYYCLRKKIYETLFAWLIWFFTQGFYIGQGFLTNDIISKYLSKPPFLLLVILIAFWNKVPKEIKAGFYLKIWWVFIFVSLISSLYHEQMPFILITVSSFFILYMLLSNSEMSKQQFGNILNLFIAVAFLQTIVSILQVLQVIPAATKAMSDGFGGQMIWEAKLDDVACGTFGPDMSHLVSWYASMIALFSVLVWAFTKKPTYLFVAALSLLQFATVDSKTVMVVMILMMAYLFPYLNKRRTQFWLSTKNFFSFVCLVAAFGCCLFIAWNSYYKYANGEYGSGDRGDLKALYKGEVSESMSTIASHWTDWGKIQGYRYLLEDFSKTPIEIVFGYGMLGYEYNGKMSYIESKDTPLMKLDDSTCSRSGLISSFAKSGLLGFALFALSILGWYRYNLKYKDEYPGSVVSRGMLEIFSIFSLLVAFLYAFDITSIPIVAFGGLVATFQKYCDLNRDSSI